MSIFNLKGALVGLLATMTIDGFTSTLYKLQLAAPGASASSRTMVLRQ